MKKLIYVALVLFISLPSFAKEELSLSGWNIFEAALKISAARGPYYEFNGTIECSQVAREVPPYGQYSKCEIFSEEGREIVKNANEVLEQIKKVYPMQRTTYYFSGTIILKAISKGIPPYETLLKTSVFVDEVY